MAQELADSSPFISDQAPTDPSEAKSIRKYANRLFGEIAVRIVAFAVDMVAFLFLMMFIDGFIPMSTLSDAVRIATWFILMTAYFAAFWVSPLRATLAQFVFGLRVLSETGGALSHRNAVIRAAALVALWGCTTLMLKQIFSAGWWIALAMIALLLFVPSLTTRRQGVHDFISHSIVVNRRHVHSIEDERRMREFLSNREPASLKASRPSVFRMLLDAVALGVPLFMMTIAVQISHQKNMAGRVAYAMTETREIRQSAEAWFGANGSWPANETELGRPLRREYPAGGYYRLEENGVVRIQFEILEELRNGSILLAPVATGDQVTWECRIEGEIETSYLPSRCR